MTSFLSPKLEALIKSALAGDTHAQNRLGDLYREGEDVDQNYAEALYWYKRSSDAGSAEGQNNVGSMYLNGLASEPDAEKAVKYYRLAAEQGLPIAQYNLGVRYREGEGVETNLTEAAKWLKIAAQSGDAYAQNDYAVLLRYGNGITKDILDATHWFIKAAKKQDVVAMGNLSSIIGELELIADAGNKKAQQYLKSIKAIQNSLNINPKDDIDPHQKSKQKQTSVKKQKAQGADAQFDLFLSNLIPHTEN